MHAYMQYRYRVPMHTCNTGTGIPREMRKRPPFRPYRYSKRVMISPGCKLAALEPSCAGALMVDALPEDPDERADLREALSESGFWLFIRNGEEYSCTQEGEGFS